MGLPQLKQEAIFTYADYLSWDEGRWELIDGEVWDMSPAPARIHQEVAGDLFALLHSFFFNKECKVYIAPFDVRFPDSDDVEDEDIDTVVQPDISVICDPARLDDRGCIGAPDLIVEILSPSTASKDLKVKRALYEQHGVREYWLIHPTDQFVMAYHLGENSLYDKSLIFNRCDVLKSAIFDKLEIELTDIFQDNSNKSAKPIRREIYI